MPRKRKKPSQGNVPCIGPVLASILAIASQAQTVGVGMGLLLTYALGLGVPFVLKALLLNRAVGRRAVSQVRRYPPSSMLPAAPCSLGRACWFSQGT